VDGNHSGYGREEVLEFDVEKVVGVLGKWV